MIARAAIIAQIIALRSKTHEAGCTLAECATAAHRVDVLSIRHSITDDEVETTLAPVARDGLQSLVKRLPAPNFGYSKKPSQSQRDAMTLFDEPFIERQYQIFDSTPAALKIGDPALPQAAVWVNIIDMIIVECCGEIATVRIPESVYAEQGCFP